MSREPGSEKQHVVAELSIKQGEGVFCLTGKIIEVLLNLIVLFSKRGMMVASDVFSPPLRQRPIIAMTSNLQ